MYNEIDGLLRGIMQKTNCKGLFKESAETAHNLLNKALDLYCIGNYNETVENLSYAHKIFLAFKDIPRVSVCLSLNALIKYLNKTESYYKSLLLLEDSRFLAESSSDMTVSAVNKFAFGQIYFHENKLNEALFYLNSASEILNDIPILQAKSYELSALVHSKLQNTKQAFDMFKTASAVAEKHNLEILISEIKKSSREFLNDNINLDFTVNDSYKNKILPKNEQNVSLLNALTEIARSVSSQSDIDNLLVTIAQQTKKVLNADRCSVFLLDKDRHELWSKVALGLNSEEIRFSADKGFAGHVVKTGEIIRIKDAYNDTRFNREIDKHTGYKTYNLLCMPVRNIKYEIIGAFQVLNKLDGDFTEADENILFAIGTNAGIAIENSMLFKVQQKMIEEQKQLFEGFINTLAASIDAKDKITLGHSNRVRLYSKIICGKLALSTDITNIVSKAAMLHDIGKIGIRDSVLQKKGALTDEEYSHIKEHVKITYDILCKTNINSSFSEITEIAASHHEKYDGTGYFRGLKADNIPLGGRILAVGDVFDAVTSVRHYRDRMPIKNALNILLEGKNKHFDGKIVDAFFTVNCDEILEILLMDYDVKLSSKDKKMFSGISLKQFAETVNSDNPSSKDKKLIDTFNSYYIRKNCESQAYV